MIVCIVVQSEANVKCTNSPRFLLQKSDLKLIRKPQPQVCFDFRIHRIYRFQDLVLLFMPIIHKWLAGSCSVISHWITDRFKGTLKTQLGNK